MITVQLAYVIKNAFNAVLAPPYVYNLILLPLPQNQRDVTNWRVDFTSDSDTECGNVSASLIFADPRFAFDTCACRG